jgi:hydroxymethylglutaryl-CoA lyase
LFKELIPAFPQIEFGAHLHTTPTTWHANVQAAYQAGCRRFDSALGGIGGCPMAADTLTGNLATENLLAFLVAQGEPLPIDPAVFQQAQALSHEVFAQCLST